MISGRTRPQWRDIPNPKRGASSRKGRAAWYPFYAGFSPDFAGWVIDSVQQTGLGCVVDPWNGAGTTTAAAAVRGLRAVGSDLNPVMVVVAKARLIDPADLSSLRPLAAEIVRLASTAILTAQVQEPLKRIASARIAEVLRAIERAIFQILVRNGGLSTEPAHLHVDGMSPLASFFYVALFRLVRRLTQPVRKKNPTWVPMHVATPNMRLSGSAVRAQFFSEVERMLELEAEEQSLFRSADHRVSIRVDASTSLTLADETVDLIITSPPYCTRLDYANATLPELLTLGYEYETSFKDLRRNLIGTTTVPRSIDKHDPQWGKTAHRFLNAVRAHDSVASSTYYYKNHCQYFRGLFASIGQIACKLRRHGTAVLVAQDSHYKEIHNDLPKIIVEMGHATGLRLQHKSDYVLRNPLAVSNPRTRAYRSRVMATESVLVLTKC